MLIIKIEKVSQDELTEILKTNSIGEWQVKCRLPSSLQNIRGVIGPIGLESDLDEVKETLKVKTDTIIDIKRVYKGKEKNPTLNVRITFQSQDLPEYVYLFHQRFKVRPFFEEPWRCFNCQGFGHSASECKSKPRCVVCSGQHIYENCPSRNLSENEKKNFPVKCANCTGEHTASYGGCPNMKFAQKVQNVRTLSRLSYRDAIKEVQKTQPVTRKVQPVQHTPVYSNSAKETSSISTQTEDSDEPRYPTLVANMTLLMVKLFKSIVKSNVDNISNNKISKIVKDTIGITIPVSALDDHQNQEIDIESSIDTSKIANAKPSKQSQRNIVNTSKQARNNHSQNSSQKSLPDTFDSHKNQKLELNKKNTANRKN